jgi:hypothetical protein
MNARLTLPRVLLTAALLTLAIPSPSWAAPRITILPQGDVPWSESIEVVVLFDFDSPAAESWREVDQLEFTLDGHGATQQITTHGQYSAPKATEIKLTTYLALQPGPHELGVSLALPHMPPVVASQSFNVVDSRTASEPGAGFFGAAPYLLWPDSAQVTARTGKVALEGSFAFNIPGAEIVEAGFMVDGVRHPAEPTGVAYYCATVDLADGTYKVQAYITDSFDHTYLSDTAEMSVSPTGLPRSTPLHQPPPPPQFKPGQAIVERYSGSVPTVELAGRFHIQFDTTGPVGDPYAPGAAAASGRQPGLHWLSYDDGVHSFDNAPPVVWRGNVFLWEYKFTKGDWQWHHMRLSGEVSDDGTLLKRLTLVDRLEGPAGCPLYSELVVTVVDVPAAPATGCPAGARLAFAFDENGWEQHLIACTYNFSDSADTSRELHLDLRAWKSARILAAFW